MDMPRVGTDFAGYQIQGIIGRGGMSVVYQAEHPRLARIVALKVLAQELAEDDRFRERFVRESRLAASLDHPNIVPIYDAGSSDDLLYIAMRFVKGDLKSVIQREGRLRLERLLPLLTQVGSALDAAHHLGLVHRDVKPANVLVAGSSGPDGRDHVYLADFGLTKHETSRSGITGTGQFVGTVDYMAPEQIEGKPVDGRCDVYALGCIVYECLTGRVPFARETDAAVIWAHLREDPPRVSDIARNLPEAVDQVIHRAMNKNADDRYQSCMAFVAGLREAADFGPSLIESRAPGPPPSRETVIRDRGTEGISPAAAPSPPVPTPSVVPAATASQVPPAAPPSEPPPRQIEPPGRMPEPPAQPPAERTTDDGYSDSRPQAPERPAAAAAPATVSPPAERERSSRLGWIVAVAAAVLVAVGLIYFLPGDNAGQPGAGGGARGGRPTEQGLVTAATQDLRPLGSFPDQVESLFLVAHVGAKNIVDWRCQRPDSALEDAIRSVTCRPGGGVSQVTYSLFHDGFRMRDYFRDLYTGQGATKEGECFGTNPWRFGWSIGPETWAHAVGGGNGEYKGQVLCYRDSTGQPHISWIDYSTKIYAEAIAPAGNEGPLYDWWRQEAGPGHPQHIHSLTAGANVIKGEKLVTGSVVRIGQSGTQIISTDLRDTNGKETQIYFDPDRSYECSLDHLFEHKQEGAPITVPVVKEGGRLVVTHFTHC